MATHRPQVIALTELLPKNIKNIDVQEFALHNYDMFVNNVPHRGVIIYAHKSLNATVVKFNDDLDFQEYVLCAFIT